MKRIIIISLGFFFVITSAFAGSSGGKGGTPSVADPFYIPNVSAIYSACTGTWDCNNPYTDTTGRTPRNLTINTGIKNLVLIVAGQSNNINTAPTAVTATNATSIDVLNVYDGAIYPGTNPVLGASWNNASPLGPGFMDTAVADKLITAGKFARVILVPVAIGGLNAALMANGGPVQNLLCVAMGRLAARGITSQTNVTFAVDWGQGEAELGLSTSQANYTTYLTQMGTNLNACGFVGRFFVNKETYISGSTYAPVQAAQVAIAGTVIGNVTFTAGADMDTLNGTNRADNTHWNDLGITNGSTLKFNAMSLVY